MNKKLTGMGLCLLLATSMCLADNNPFDDAKVTVDTTKADEKDTAKTATVATSEDTDTATSTETATETQKETSTKKSVEYTVERGDYLMKIARKYYNGDSDKWTLLVEANKDRYPSLLSNPNLIEVGWVLTIPDTDGESNTVASNTTSSSGSSSSSGSTSSGSSTLGHTQASELGELGTRAYNEYLPYTEDCARGEWIRKVGEIVKNTNTFGMKKSLIIAQIINESGWMRAGNSLSAFNNVLGINTDMGRIKPSMQTSTWSKKQTSGNNNVTQWSADGSHIVGTYESMRHYDSIEECIEDYAEVMSLYHPECKGNNNIEAYRSFLEGYTPNPNASTTDKYIRIIKTYNLERFDE